MAGSFMHMTKPDGRPINDRFGEGTSLENGGDVVEALEECYGMIWFLVKMILDDRLGREPTREDFLQEIFAARYNYEEGVRLGKEM